MNKKIENYLPFYLGCDMLAVSTSEDYEDEYFQKGDVGKLILINQGGITIAASPDYDSYPYVISFESGTYVCGGIELFKIFKPMFRHLNDMTEEERQQYDTLSATMYSLNKLQDQIKTEASVTFYLLSKHFDLFGLIELGLALDKTKLQNHE